jgi:hypothetical protein
MSHDTVTTHTRACNELGNLMVEHGLASRVWPNPLDNTTARIDVTSDQMVALRRVIEAGVLAQCVHEHPSNGTWGAAFIAATLHDPGTSNGVA